MASAMESAVDESGKHLYQPEHIYQWLERIRIMGLEQSFKLTVRNIGV